MSNCLLFPQNLFIHNKIKTKTTKILNDDKIFCLFCSVGRRDDVAAIFV